MIYVLALMSIMLGSVGQFILKLGSADVRTGDGIWATLLSFINIKISAAVACFVVSMVLWVFVLRKMELSIAYPMVSLGYVFVMLLSFYFLHEQLSLTKFLGTGLIVAGVVVLNAR